MRKIFNWLFKILTADPMTGIVPEEVPNVKAAIEAFKQQVPTKEKAMQDALEDLKRYNTFEEGELVYNSYSGRIERITSKNLHPYDYGSGITFNTNMDVYISFDYLCKLTDEEKELLKDYI